MSSATPARSAHGPERSLVFGAIQGRIALPPAIAETARAQAAEFYAKQVAISFSGDAVDVVSVPKGLPTCWIPHDALDQFGLRARSDGEWTLTADVEPHIDDINGPTLCWVLHNDGLRFSQGRQRHVTRAGDWFVFDDCRPHGVAPTESSTAFVAWTVPLIGRVAQRPRVQRRRIVSLPNKRVCTDL
jgi:hypothetical protein